MYTYVCKDGLTDRQIGGQGDVQSPTKAFMPHRSLLRGQNSSLPPVLLMSLIVSHRPRTQKQSVWNERRQGWSLHPKNLEGSPDSAYRKRGQHGLWGLGGGRGWKAPQTLGLSHAKQRRHNGPRRGISWTLLLQNALGAKRFDKAQIRADKRQLCSHILGSCHPAAPWGYTCGIWIFLTQRPGERKTGTQHLINYPPHPCFCWPHSDTSLLLTVDNNCPLIA